MAASTAHCGSRPLGSSAFFRRSEAEQGSPLNLSRVAPALNAIDRAVPGLAQRIAPQTQQSVQAGLLALLGQPVEIEGKRGVAVPVRFTDGAVSFGSDPVGACSSGVLGGM